MKKNNLFFFTICLMLFISFPVASAKMKFNGVISENGHKYAICNSTSSWNEAKEFCEQQGGYLVTITSKSEQKTIEKLLKQYGTKEAFWIGAKKDTEWEWITGEPFRYTHWADGEPNSSESVMIAQILFTKRENIGLFSWDDTWDDGDIAEGIKSQGFICEWENPSVGVALEKNKYKTINHNEIFDTKSLSEDEFCVLSVITQQKYRLIEKTIYESFDNLFKAANKNTKTIKNFLLNKESINIYQSSYNASDDIFNSKIKNTGSKKIKNKDDVIFSGEIEYKGHKYALCNAGTTWEKAEDICNIVDGYLVSITSEEEQKAIEELLFLYSEKEAYWIGACKKTDWKWRTGESFNYNNWAKGEPSNSHEKVMFSHIYSPLKKDKKAYSWDDTWNSGDKKDGIEDHGFICEWDDTDVSIKKYLYSKHTVIRQLLKERSDSK